jgi:hypothetical protein
MLFCCVGLLVCGCPAFADDAATLPDPSRAKRARPSVKKNGAAAPAAPSDPAKPATHDSRLNSILEGLLELNKITPSEPPPPPPAQGQETQPKDAPSKDTPSKDAQPKDASAQPGVPAVVASDAVQTALALSRHELLFAYAAIGQVADLHTKEVYDRQWALTMLVTYAKTLSDGRAAVESLARHASVEEKRSAEGLSSIYELLLQETQAYKLYVESGDKNHLLAFSSRRKDVQSKIQELVKVKRPAGPKPASKE